MLAKTLTQVQNIKVTILTTSFLIKERIVIDNTNLYDIIYLKSPKPYFDLLTLYKFRIDIINKYLINILPKFDIIHIHGTEHQYEVPLYNSTKPIIISIQGIISECIKVLPKSRYKTKLFWELTKKYELLAFKYFNNYICRTSFDSEFVNRHTSSANIVKIWEIIRPEFYVDIKYLREKNILFLGGTNEMKGIQYCLSVLNELRKNDDYKLILVGKTDRNILSKMIKRGNFEFISNSAIIIKSVLTAAEIVDCYKKSICLLHPSLIDNSPNTVCEAQIAGLPVIASNVGGVSSLIEHEKTGLLSSFDVTEISNNILRLTQDEKFWYEISDNSKSIARIRHNPKVILNDTINYYNSLIC